jgi:spermidine synthase
MKPWETIAKADGGYELKRRGDEYLVLVHGKVLMGSRAHQSEEALARIGCEGLGPGAHVVIGGLGFGYTLRAALDALPSAARVTVAELSPAVVAWNRGELAALARAPLSDPRVTVDVRDVQKVLNAQRGACDAVLLDVDNGPFAIAADGNDELYAAPGLALAQAALKPGGRIAVWSASPDGRFERQLRFAGLAVRRVPAGTGQHVVYLATLGGAPRPRGPRR